MGGLSTMYMSGDKDLTLLRRHESERCFGVQVAGADVGCMAQFAQFAEEHIDCDFVDINCGCPLDNVTKKGMGARLMMRDSALEGIIRCMSSLLRTKALTLKMRTGHLPKGHDYGGRYAHKLVPLLEKWGVHAITIHGRTSLDRYKKLADWNYVKTCSSMREHNIPLIGSGDVFNWVDVQEHYEQHGVDSIMLGRGALIKPWIFTEIKERRYWDISGSERLDMIRDYVNFGLEHWGSDVRGVETTRRYLLEWLSFACRYVPIGLVEVMPYKMNWRPESYFGRTDIETKLASTNSKDWIEISEMFLGKVPDAFTFAPKHKSNSYEEAAS